MSTKYVKSTAAAMLLLSSVAITPVMAAETPVAATGDFSMTVLHTNDTHANLATTAERAALVKKLQVKKSHTTFFLTQATYFQERFTSMSLKDKPISLS